MYSSSACFAPGDLEILDRLSVELHTGVEVQRASCVCPVCPLPLFVVFSKEHALDFLIVVKPAPVTPQDTSGEVTFFFGAFLGFLFLVF